MKSLGRPRDLEEILSRIARVRPEARARWGRMSAHQMLCHLWDAYRLMTEEPSGKPVGGPVPPWLMRFVALSVPLRWPRGVVTTPDLDQDEDGTPPGEFAEDKARLASLIDTLPTRRPEFECRPHPVFGRLSSAAWLRWGYLHADHHLRQFDL